MIYCHFVAYPSNIYCFQAYLCSMKALQKIGPGLPMKVSYNAALIKLSFQKDIHLLVILTINSFDTVH